MSVVIPFYGFNNCDGLHLIASHLTHWPFLLVRHFQSNVLPATIGNPFTELADMVTSPSYVEVCFVEVTHLVRLAVNADIAAL